MSTLSDVPAGFALVEEGAARILFPSANQVFYNRPQVVNRDLSVLVIRHFVEMRRLEALAKREAQRARALSAVSTAAASGAVGTGAAEAENEDEEPAAMEAEQTDEAFGGVSILEALSATGLRAVRYAKVRASNAAFNANYQWLNSIKFALLPRVFRRSWKMFA